MDWFTQLKNAKKCCMVQDNVKKVHFDFGNGKEMVEEYNLDTNVVARRAWRRVTSEMGGEGGWEVEVGDPQINFHKDLNFLIKEADTQPVVTRRNTRRNLEWRIRNMPYPLQTYDVIADSKKNILIVKTSNKKYYKVFQIPELSRLRLQPEQKAIHLTHRFKTLIITYNKPQELVHFEKEVLEEIIKKL